MIGETLRRLRKEKRLTLEGLGEAAELGRGQLSRIENNHQEATLSTLAKILSSQGVSRREFFRRYDLVESEALAIQRQQSRAGASGPPGWPQEIQDVLSRVEAFIHAKLDNPQPVAQGAVEIGDFVVLFRVVPKDAAVVAEPAGPAAAPAEAQAKPASRSKRPGRKGRRSDARNRD
ncbi:MAG: helix-turn-helix domain-containing protein [Thermoanaerobaculia bacterium]